MKFAIVDNNKITATKGLKGLCPNCGSEVIAKCGEFKISHWAHKGARNCDPWWENETEWHREWKSNFSNDWQEVILTDELTGEKHIADIRTPYGLVIEFQHSHIDPQERTKREKFYKKMVWVVDGTRLKRDYPRFLKAKERFRLTNKRGYFIVDYPEECFPTNWINSSVPILFDYKGIENVNYASDWRYPLYCLFPKSNNTTVVAILSRHLVVQSVIKGEFLSERENQAEQNMKQPTSGKTFVRRPTPTHYYDPRRGKYVRKRRL